MTRKENLLKCIRLERPDYIPMTFAARFAGKICLNIDIDRQRITRFGAPAQVEALIREEIDKLATPQGGLIMTYGMYPGIPLANARALMDAMERYMDYPG